MVQNGFKLILSEWKNRFIIPHSITIPITKRRKENERQEAYKKFSKILEDLKKKGFNFSLLSHFLECYLENKRGYQRCKNAIDSRLKIIEQLKDVNMVYDQLPGPRTAIDALHRDCSALYQHMALSWSLEGDNLVEKFKSEFALQDFVALLKKGQKKNNQRSVLNRCNMARLLIEGSLELVQNKKQKNIIHNNKSAFGLIKELIKLMGLNCPSHKQFERDYHKYKNQLMNGPFIL